MSLHCGRFCLALTSLSGTIPVSLTSRTLKGAHLQTEAGKAFRDAIVDHLTKYIITGTHQNLRSARKVYLEYLRVAALLNPTTAFFGFVPTAEYVG